jgi:cytidine deaminase
MTETEWRALVQAAKAASEHAYCPYSHFAVGAAVMWGDGEIASGCNVENASFGLTICAERNAIFRAVAEGATSIAALAIYTPTTTPVTPCGACRQVMAEFGAETRVRAICDGQSMAEYGIQELLPKAFELLPETAQSDVEHEGQRR